MQRVRTHVSFYKVYLNLLNQLKTFYDYIQKTLNFFLFLKLFVIAGF